MKYAISNLSTFAKGLSLAALLIVTSAPVALAESDKPWTSIGSATTADDGNVTYTSNIAYLNGNGTTLRYNVVAVDGLIAEGPAVSFPRMSVRFRDNGATGHVVVRLKRTSIATGSTVQLLVLDSDDYAGSSSFQTRTKTGCGDDLFAFDFINNAYFIEVTMTRTAAGITPGVAALQLDLNGACFVLPA